jgi:hypothetical protein
VLERIEPWLVGAPLVESGPVDRAADLLGAGGAHGARIFVEAQAGRIEGEAQMVEQPPDLSLRIVDQPFVDDQMGWIGQDAAEMRRNYLPWKRPEGNYPDRDGLFIAVVPTQALNR